LSPLRYPVVGKHKMGAESRKRRIYNNNGGGNSRSVLVRWGNRSPYPIESANCEEKGSQEKELEQGRGSLKVSPDEGPLIAHLAREFRGRGNEKRRPPGRGIF